MTSGYGAYKTSTVPWIDVLPAHWETKPLLAVAQQRDVRNTGMTEENLLSLSYGNIIRKDISSNEGLLPESFETYQIVEPNDVVFRLTDLQNDKRSLRTGQVRERGIITSAYLAVEPTGILPDYLSHLMRAYDLSKVFYSMGGGLRQSMKYGDVRRMPIVVPPPLEQIAIATFLDRETGKIDALAEEQRRLIALLKEKRQAVISHAVTKGLDPSARLKPSGMEWLGDVPEHWDVVACRHLLARIEQGWSPECESRQADLNEWGVLKAGCANGGVFREGENKALPEKLTPLPDLEVRDGDVLMSRANGSPENVGATAFVERTRSKLMLSDKIFRLHPSPRIRPRFLALLLGSVPLRYQIERAISGADGLANNLPQSALKAFVGVAPPLDEQDIIVERVQVVAEGLGILASKAEEAVALLLERRAALISAAVTGQIDIGKLSSALDLGVPVLVAAEIVGRLSHMPTFGRVKFQKVVYLAEVEAGISEFGGAYLRAAAGPLDRELIDQLEADLVRAGNIAVEQPEGIGGPVRYRLSAAGTAYGEELAAALGERYAKLHHIIDAVADLDTKGTEAVATLYAVWNDFLIDGKQPSDDEIAASVLHDWHPEKRIKFRTDELLTWLGWMRRHNLVPSGNGPRTTTGRLFA